MRGDSGLRGNRLLRIAWRPTVAAQRPGGFRSGHGRKHIPLLGQAAPRVSTLVRHSNILHPETSLTDLRKQSHQPTGWTGSRSQIPRQGVQLATMRNLATTGPRTMTGAAGSPAQFLSNFITEIDGLDIHFIHVWSKHQKRRCRCHCASRLAFGSIIEQMKIIEPLTNPLLRMVGRKSDAFHLVIPSLPGYGVSPEARTRRLESASHCKGLGRTDAASWLYQLRGAGRDWGNAVAAENMRVAARRADGHPPSTCRLPYQPRSQNPLRRECNPPGSSADERSCAQSARFLQQEWAGLRHRG